MTFRCPLHETKQRPSFLLIQLNDVLWAFALVWALNEPCCHGRWANKLFLFHQFSASSPYSKEGNVTVRHRQSWPNWNVLQVSEPVLWFVGRVWAMMLAGLAVCRCKCHTSVSYPRIVHLNSFPAYWERLPRWLCSHSFCVTVALCLSQFIPGQKTNWVWF